MPHVPAVREPSRSRLAVPALLAVLALLVLAGFGCAKPAQRTVTEDGTVVDTTRYDERTETGTITFTNEDGTTGTIEVRGQGDRPPENFPSDFPVMRGMTALHYSSINQADGFMAGGEWTTSASVGDVFAYYRDELPEGNWTVTSTSTYGDSSFIMFSRRGDERYAGTMSMERQSDNSTTVALTYMFLETLPDLGDWSM